MAPRRTGRKGVGRKPAPQVILPSPSSTPTEDEDAAARSDAGSASSSSSSHESFSLQDDHTAERSRLNPPCPPPVAERVVDAAASSAAAKPSGKVAAARTPSVSKEGPQGPAAPAPVGRAGSGEKPKQAFIPPLPLAPKPAPKPTTHSPLPPKGSTDEASQAEDRSGPTRRQLSLMACLLTFGVSLLLWGITLKLTASNTGRVVTAAPAPPRRSSRQKGGVWRGRRKTDTVVPSAADSGVGFTHQPIVVRHDDPPSTAAVGTPTTPQPPTASEPQQSLAPAEGGTAAVPAIPPPPPPPPPLTATPGAKSVLVQNAGTSCAFSVDNFVNSTDPPLPEEFIRRCGGPVTGRAKGLEGIPDPMLECTDFARFCYEHSFAHEGGFRWHDGRFLRKNDAIKSRLPAGQDMKNAPPAILWLLSDYGCYTIHRAPEGGVLVGTPERYFGAMTKVSRQMVDLGDAMLQWHYHTKELGWNDDSPTRRRAYFDAAANTLFGSVDGWKRVPTIRVASKPAQLSVMPPIVGAPTVVIIAQFWHGLIGQAFEEYIMMLSRAWSAGVLDKPGVTVLALQTNDNEQPLRTWLEPLLPKVKFQYIGDNHIVHVEDAYFPTFTFLDSTEPCTTMFITDVLLPNALRRLRDDKNFRYGNEDVRKNGAASDEDWAKTFPKKIAIIKENRHAYHKRAFTVTPAGRKLFEGLGYVFVSDASPFTYRMALISYADVVVTTFGALQTIVARLYGGFNPLRRDGGRPPLRLIALMHSGYHAEQVWYAANAVRVGQQDGLKVAVSEIAGLSPMHCWTKHVVVMGQALTEGTITARHLTFEAKDLTLDPALATDFPSRWYPEDPMTNDRQRWKMNSSWADVPKFGARCPHWGPNQTPPPKHTNAPGQSVAPETTEQPPTPVPLPTTAAPPGATFLAPSGE